MLTAILMLSAAAFLAAFRFYGGFLARLLALDDARATPSHTDYDGVDRVPAHPAILLGHHFSSIAGAGPIVGPIIAAVAFGWLPVFLWIVAGSILIGGVHDLTTLIASVRHHGRSVAEIVREHISPLSYRIFLVFVWLLLVYVLLVFIDLTADTFAEDGGVASASIMFIALAVGFGLCVYRLRLTILFSSLVFVPLVFLAVWLGEIFPLPAGLLPALLAGGPGKTWSLALIVYCFIASTMPVWILLQPRDYLSSFLLYASVLGGFAGIIGGGFPLAYPAFAAWNAPHLGPLFPILFITVACGACSGFHSLVGSGTSSKQLDRESDARLVGYGAMLIEGVAAVIALSTVVMISRSDALAGEAPMRIFGAGMGEFLSVIGIPRRIGTSFGLLALSSFILTSLDTATRLGRYIVEEFFNRRGTAARYLSTLATLAPPAALVLVTLRDPQGDPIPAWKAVWPAFGATNQLLAALALLVVTLWLRKSGRGTTAVLLPTLFMTVMTLWALALLILMYGCNLIGVIAAALTAMAAILLFEAARAWRR